MKPGEKYIVANGHHRYAFAKRQGVRGFNAQILREADGITAQDAMIRAAEANIADGKGSIYDQVRLIRNIGATRGEAAADTFVRQSGRGGKKAGSIALEASPQLQEAFVNERISPDHAAAIAEAAPRNADAQRVALRSAIEGKPPQFAANVAKAAALMAGQPKYRDVDLFGEDDSAFIEMERMADDASRVQSALQERITASRSAARRADVAREMGVDVADPVAVNRAVSMLQGELDRWKNWPMHPDLTKRLRGGAVDADAIVRDAMAGPEAETVSEETEEGSVPPVRRPSPPPPAKPEAEGQLLPEGEMPFNLAGEEIRTAEPAPPPADTRTDAERDADSGQDRLFEDRTASRPARPAEAEVRRLVAGFVARRPGKRPSPPPPARTEAEERHLRLIRKEIDAYFGGDVPSGVRVVWEPGAVWDASFDRGAGVVTLNAAMLRPGEAAFKAEHEIGHLLFQDAEFSAAFEALWNALPKAQQDRISRLVGKAVEKGHYAAGDAFEETRVRALEAIRRMAAGDHADAAAKRAWRRFVAALVRAWKRITGREPVDPERLASAMVEIGVVRLRSGAGGGDGIALSAIDFEAFRDWALREVASDDFFQEDAGRLWVASDVEGNVNQVFGSFRDADAYFRTMSGRGEFLWDVTESYERMIGGIPERKPWGRITEEDARRSFYPVSPLPGETPSEAGNLPRVSPSGAAVTAAMIPDSGLRYGLPGGMESRRLPAPDKPHRKGGRIFSVADEDAEFKENILRHQLGSKKAGTIPKFPTSSLALRSAGITATHITLPYSVIAEKESKHEIPIHKILRIPEAIRNPVFIFESETQTGARLVITEIPHMGERLSVAIHLDREGSIAEIRSLHKRRPSQAKKYIEDKKTLYYHQEKSRNWLAQELSGVQFPAVWVQLRQTKGIVSDSDLQGKIFSLSDGIQREQAAAAQSLANLEATFRVSFFAGDFDGASAALDSTDAETFETFVRKLVRFAGAGDGDAAGMLAWIDHANAGTRPAVDSDPETDALIRAMRARFPRRRGRALADHKQRHFTQDSFERAFSKHVADGDFQAAYEAVRDTDDAVRIAALRKWMKAGDGESHKRTLTCGSDSGHSMARIGPYVPRPPSPSTLGPRR